MAAKQIVTGESSLQSILRGVKPIVPMAHVIISSSSDIYVARQKGRGLAEQLGFSLSEATLFATVISELGRGILMRADFGEITFEPLYEGDRVGIRLTTSYGTPPILSEPNVAVDEHTAEQAARQLARPGETFTLELVDDKTCMQWLRLYKRVKHGLANEKVRGAEL